MKAQTLLLPIFLALLINGMLSSCSKYYHSKANEKYDRTAYQLAAEDYERVLSKKEIPEARLQLAKCYAKMGHYTKAEESFQIYTSKNPTASGKDELEYAAVLMNNGKYTEARDILARHHHIRPGDPVLENMLMSCDRIGQQAAENPDVTIGLFEVPTESSYFSPVFYKEGLVFCSDEPSRRSPEYEWTGRGFLDLYYAEIGQDGRLSSMTSLSEEINTRYHDGPSVFTSGGDRIYFTRSNLEKKHLKKDNNHFNHLRLMEAELAGNKWVNVRELPINREAHSLGQPAISKDGKTLYFAADFDEGQGGIDIYKSVNVDGRWSPAINLGSRINTPGNEMFPYLWEDKNGQKALYFASDGHPGLGGLDLYFIDGLDLEGDVEHMSAPINSSRDDFGILLHEDRLNGYFSSNRDNDEGIDKIFNYTEAPDIILPEFYVKGKVMNRVGGIVIPHADVEIENKTNGDRLEITTDAGGEFLIRIDRESAYSIMAKKVDFMAGRIELSTIGLMESDTLSSDIFLELIVVNEPIVLKNIYYDLDKWFIRADASIELDKLAQVLEDNPEIRIELSAHTDSRATDAYNMELSQKRAESAVSYIIQKGIESSRINARGYGESRLVNRCVNGVRCPDAVHEENRRTEFQVIAVDTSWESEPKTSTISSALLPLDWNMASRGYSYAIQLGIDHGIDEIKFAEFNRFGQVYYEDSRSGYYRYVLGVFSDRITASSLLKEIRLVAKDAFLVTYQDGIRVE